MFSVLLDVILSFRYNTGMVMLLIFKLCPYDAVEIRLFYSSLRVELLSRPAFPVKVAVTDSFC